MAFRIALSDKAGKLPLMKISDALTWLAEAIVKELMILAWDQNAKSMVSLKVQVLMILVLL